jgi:hypothetical protein
MGLWQKKMATPSMNLIKFMEVYPDAICKKILTNTIPAVYQFESPEHGVSVYLQHALSFGG